MEGMAAAQPRLHACVVSLIHADREADGGDIFLNGGADDGFRFLMQADVDDFETCFDERADNDLCTAVVAIETGLGDEDAAAAGGRRNVHAGHGSA